MTTPQIITHAHKFSSFAIANSFRNRCEKTMGIILGDNNRYWVLPIGQAERLYRAGYEYAA